VLNSWKEIASYLGLGVRTVQRYEREYRLPVRRIEGKSRGAVLALPKDLDDWLRRTPLHNLDSDPSENLSNKHLLQEHQKAMSTLKSSLTKLNEKITEGQRILLRQRWFGQEDR